MSDYKPKEIATVLIILILTIGYFLIQNIGVDEQELDLFFFRIGTFGFPDVSYVFYFGKMKVLLICFSLLWFWTCKHWWRLVILTWTIVETSKLISLMGSDSDAFDEYTILYVVPIILLVVLLFLTTIKRMSYKHKILKIKESLDEEINTMFFDIKSGQVEHDFKYLKQQFKEIKKERSKDKKLYLESLLNLKKAILDPNDKF